MKCLTLLILIIFAAWFSPAGWGDDRVLTTEQQAAVVSAVFSIEGFGETGQWIMITTEKTESGINAVRVWRQIAVRPDESSEDNPPELYATVRLTRFDSQVEYERRGAGIKDKESAVKRSVAFLAKRGILPASLWITCLRVDEGFLVFYEDTEPKRVGFHGLMTVTDTSLRFSSGR